MMEANARTAVEEIAWEHRYDRDGGYALVADLRKVLDSEDPEFRRSFREALLQIVAAEHPELWGVALEALVQEGAPGAARRLEQLFRTGGGGPELRYFLLKALMRMRHRESLMLVRDHLERLMDQVTRGPEMTESLEGLLPLTVLIDPELWLSLSSRYFADILGRRRQLRAHEGLVAAIAQDCLAVDDSLLSRLVQETGRRRPAAAKWLKRAMLDYLNRPWMAQEYGAERIESLRQSLQAVPS